jgi:hypothetical protein
MVHAIVALMALSLIEMGFIYIDHCPINYKIPFWLIGVGIFDLLLVAQSFQIGLKFFIFF